MKFHRWLYLVSAAIILSACGGPIADTPAVVAEGDPLVESLITEAETLGVDLSVQTNSKNYRYIKVGKKVEGYAPPDAKYKFILACKKGKKYVVVIKTELKVGEYKGFRVSDNFWDCFAVEYGTVGDYVKFDVYQSHKHNWKETYHTYKGKYEAPKYEHYYGRYVASKNFYLTKKYVKIDVTNKYEEKNKEIEVVFKKEFKLGYDGYPVHPDGYELKLTLICGGVSVAETTKPHDTVKVAADKVRGKHCELVEYFKDDGYKTVQYLAVVDDGVGDSPALYNDCNNARDYYCEFKRFDVDKHATKLVLTITNNVKELLTVHITKRFLTSYGSHPVEPYGYDLKITLSCGGKTVAETGSTDYSLVVYADQVRGKNCEVEEYFKDDEYKARSYEVKYDDGKAAYSTWNDCNTAATGPDTCKYSRYDVSADATKLDVHINNYLDKKDYNHPV